MHKTGSKHMYFEDNMNQILELDYSDNKISMGIVLPKGRAKLTITGDQFNYYISNLSEQTIDTIEIPKFQQQSRFKIDNLFKKMGMRELFTNADLSEITPSTGDLYISDILHQVYINVDEQGTEASGATVAIATWNSVPKNNNNPSFIANYPFIYYIRFKPTNTLLFIGSYY